MIQLGLFEEIKEILMAILDVEAGDILPERYLVRDLGVESIDFLELAVSLNGHFKIPVQDDVIFLRNLRLYLAEAKEQAVAPLACLKGHYPFLPQARLEVILSDIDNGPVIQVQDLVEYVQWQMDTAQAA